MRQESASVNVYAMEEAIDQVTKWMIQKWPELPQQILLDRSHTVNAYLASLAIRQREFVAHFDISLLRLQRNQVGSLHRLSRDCSLCYLPMRSEFASIAGIFGGNQSFRALKALFKWSVSSK